MATQVLEKKELTLLNTDRCDKCGAQAYMVAMKDGGELMFCAHHGTKYLSSLLETGWDIHDERDVLNQLGVQ